MAIRITMPQLGESVVDGTVGEWLKQIGDTVAEFEPIVRVSTDKVDTEIPSPAAGVLLAIYVPEGETVDAGALLGMIGAPGEELLADPAPVTNGHHAPVEVSQTERTPRPEVHASAYSGHISPVVARMAQEHALDLSLIQGSGRNGRIQKRDVLAYLEKQADAPQTDLAPWEQPGTGDLFKPTVSYEEDDVETAPVVHHAPQAPSPRPIVAPVAGNIPGELVKLSSMRRSIAQHMVESKLHIAPHVTTVMEVDLTQVSAHREVNKAQFARQGIKLTFTPYFVAACASALLEHPALNARWTDEGLFLHHVAHIGMAVALDDGLIVPVIRNAQDYNLAGLARQVNDLAERARSRQLKPDEVREGTFSITNHGVSGSLFATPVINQPQSAILGVGLIEKRVKVVNDMIAIRPCSYFSLTFDHRVADGATADAFLMAVKHRLENWS